MMNRSDPDRINCAGCIACCKNENLALYPEHGDDPEQYEVALVKNPITGGNAIALKRKPNGDCIYLGATGCTIYARRPYACRRFNCVKWLENIGNEVAPRNRTEREAAEIRAVKSGRVPMGVYRAAIQRRG